MFIAEDFPRFKSLFVDGLKNMLTDDELGAFILVLANSLQDSELQQLLLPDLLKYFEVLKAKHERGKLQATRDDLDVFEKLLVLDVATLPVWQQHQLGNWTFMVNAMRQLRPARVSGKRQDSIFQPFDENGFNFNKPFLAPEILWQGDHNGRNLRVLYNKFPFVKYHLLIVISPELNMPQVLDPDLHRYIYELVGQYGERLPGFGVGYNSLAAGASVNHLHFQGFVDTQPLAIESAPDVASAWNGVSHRCSSAEEAWQMIRQCMDRDIAFNCLYRPGACYLMPRAYQGTVDVPDCLRGAGWSDLAGLVTVASDEVLNTVSPDRLDSTLSEMYRSPC